MLAFALTKIFDQPFETLLIAEQYRKRQKGKSEANSSLPQISKLECPIGSCDKQN